MPLCPQRTHPGAPVWFATFIVEHRALDDYTERQLAVLIASERAHSNQKKRRKRAKKAEIAFVAPRKVRPKSEI